MTNEELYAPGHTPIFSPQAQGAFLDNLSINGNVRHACKVARVSPQTAYRARRKSPALATLWDAALLSARTRAEDVLATRALDGVEESVFYHGEEVATRIRYDSRLLLAHLARLDRLAEREEVTAHLTQLDDMVDALKRGEGLPDRIPVETGISSEHREALAFAGAQWGYAGAQWGYAGARRGDTGAQHERCDGGEILPQDSVPSVPRCREPSSSSEAVGQTKTTEQISEEDARLDAMHAARPEEALTPYQLASSVEETGEIEALQLEAFEAGLPEWWLITSDEALEAALEVALAADACEGVSCAGQEESCDETHDDGKRSFGAGTGGERAAERGDLCEDPRHRR